VLFFIMVFVDNILENKTDPTTIDVNDDYSLLNPWLNISIFFKGNLDFLFSSISREASLNISLTNIHSL